MGNNPSEFKDKDSASRPVENVSWSKIAAFNTATGLRLPTEAEWEYACRAGTTTQFHSMPGYPNGTNDASLLGNIAWYSDNSGMETHAVGGKAANAFGMYDMSGNVWERCNDYWYNVYRYIDFGKIQPIGPATGLDRVLHGGDWVIYSSRCRSSNLSHFDPDFRDIGIGFRVARTP
jgi:formylglycine-generating enzyme required for sulfatase activity